MKPIQPTRLYPMGPEERRRLEALNVDLKRPKTAPSTAPSSRAKLAAAAVSTAANRFELCRTVARLTHSAHNPHRPIQESLNRALAMVAEAPRFVARPRQTCKEEAA